MEGRIRQLLSDRTSPGVNDAQKLAGLDGVYLPGVIITGEHQQILQIVLRLAVGDVRLFGLKIRSSMVVNTGHPDFGAREVRGVWNAGSEDS